MEKEVIGILGSIVGILIAVAGVIKLSSWQSNKAVEGERGATQKLIDQQQKRIDELSRDLSLARDLIVDLQTQVKADQETTAEQAAKIEETEHQLTTVCKALEDVQKRLDTAEESLTKANRENERLTQVVIEKDRRIGELETENTALKHANAAFREVFTYIGTTREKEALSSAESAQLSTAQRAEETPPAGESIIPKKESEEQNK